MMKRSVAAAALISLIVAGCGAQLPQQTKVTTTRAKATATATKGKIEHVTMHDARDFIASVPDMYLLDVREPDEFAQAHIQYFVNRPLGQLDQWSTAIPKTAPVMVVCHSGRRSMLAAQQLVDKGYLQVFNLDGGVQGWSKAGFPLIP